eukprot:sb/3462957/
MGDQERVPIVPNEEQANYNATNDSTVRINPDTSSSTVAAPPPEQAQQVAAEREPAAQTVAAAQTTAQETTTAAAPQQQTEGGGAPPQYSRYNLGGYNVNPEPPPLDDRPLPTRTRWGIPAQSHIPPPGLSDINWCLDTAAFSKYHSLQLAAGCLAMLGSGAQIFLTCVIQAFASCKYNLDNSDKTWLLCSIFILYPFGSCFLGWTSDRWGRKWSMIFSLYAVLITGLIQVAASEWWILFVARLFMGFFLPGTTNIPLINWLEISAYPHREEGMLALLCLFGTGAAYDFCLAGIFVSLNSAYAYEYITGLAVLPIAFAVVFAHFTREGPRFLGVASTLKEADESLRDHGYTPQENPNTTIPLDIYFQNQRGNICIVFSYLCCPVSLFATLYFCNLYVQFGIILILPYMFYWDYCGLGFGVKSHGTTFLEWLVASISNDCDSINVNSFIYLLAVSGCIIAGLVIGYFTQMYFGSRVTLLTYSIASTITLAFLAVCWSYIITIIELVIGLILVMSTQYSLWASGLILAPTFMRSSTLGYIDAWGKIGALCAVAICAQLGDRMLLDVVFWTFLAVGILEIFFVCLVTVEAKGSRIFDNIPSDPRANEPPPLCMPPGPPPPPPPPPRYPPPPPPHRPYYY